MARVRTTIGLNGLDVPAFQIDGAQDGPRLSLIGGIHGCEHSSIAAVTTVATSSKRSARPTTA